MVEKLINKAKVVRKNWFEAYRMMASVKGHYYYDIPEEIKYRYPAPGSCPIDRTSYPHLFKKHWKTPFRDSPYNIRQKEKKYDRMKNTEHYISEIYSPDPAGSEMERLAALEQQPNKNHLIVADQLGSMESPERIEAIWAEQEQDQEVMRLTCRDYTHSHWDLNDEYNQVTFLAGGYDKDYSGISNDWRSRQTLVELEYWIEEVAGAQRIAEQKFKMYKGTVKKWQILDDSVHDRD